MLLLGDIKMKVSLGDAYDRSQYFKQQADYISKGCQDCFNNRPDEFANHPFYIFAHKREINLDERIALFNQDQINFMSDARKPRLWRSLEEVPSTRLIWSPRLTKPSPQTNSMLFKAYPPGDNIRVIWMIPDREMWGQYKKGNLTENKIVVESIYDFENHREKLGAKENDDLPDEEVKRIYDAISRSRQRGSLHIE